MRLVLAIYTSDAYKESYLPSIDNADFEMIIRADGFALQRDIQLKMEVVNNQWFICRSPAYRVFHEGYNFEGRRLENGQILQILTQNDEKLAVLVWSVDETLSSYRKFRVTGNYISIGKDKDNDICYTAQGVVSHHHAEIVYTNQGAVVHDLSTNGTYLENQRISGEQTLQFGNLMSIYGLSIQYLGNVLAVNCLNETLTIHSDCLEPLEKLNVPTEPQETKKNSVEEQMVHISPRVIPKLHDDEEVIDPVPQKREEDHKPAWMSILPSMTMVLPMVLGYSLMNNGNAGIGIFISVGSAVIGVTWAIINLRFNRKENRRIELHRMHRYEEYLVRRADEIRRKFEFNRAALLGLYPDAATCSSYTSHSPELWARKRTQSDFLFVRLGLGEQPFQVKIKVPHHGFTINDDELAERPEKIAQSYQTMRGVPLGVNLMEHNVVGLLSGKSHQEGLALMRQIAVQIAANHSYTDVKIAALYGGENAQVQQWSFLRWLPHVWNEERSMRYVASEENGVNDVIYALAQMLRVRSEQLSSNYGSKNTIFYPHYVLFVDDPSMLESQIITKYLYEAGRELGITTVMLADNYENLPNACDFIIERDDAYHGMYEVKEGGDVHRAIVYDNVSPTQAVRMAKRFSAMRVSQVECSSDIPSSLSFFDMMEIHQLNELNVLDHWRKNRTYESMKALVGQKAGGQDCYLDINEKYHGPHGLVAGTTGSGKSETLQTYILSLAVNYSPLDVGFFIIDFKGGGMANLFSNLPHMLGQISNLSGNQVRRAMVSIKSENMRRQRIFGEFGVNHIDAYTKLVKSREATIPIPHLLIIIDEFAELKREEPEFMRELISVAQVGRSLGVHLILATQKPSGTVDDNIWSNTKFKLCLRVADKQDSNDMLHKPDAAYLTQAGRCYLQVGNDELYELFQSGWSGAVYDASGGGGQASAVLLDLQGRMAVSGSRAKGKRKRQAARLWIVQIVNCVRQCWDNQTELSAMDGETRSNLAKQVVAALNQSEECYPASTSNLRRIEDVLQLWPQTLKENDEITDELMQRFQQSGKKLPERKEKTQLEAVVDYLADMAVKNNYVNHQTLWMPVLPERLYIDELDGYSAQAYQGNDWQNHGDTFRLSAYIGRVDDPENQMQFPLNIDLAKKGHLMVVGGVTSGKSTFLQTLMYSFVSSYSPAEVNLYAIDFSSQMLCPFEEDVHVGGVILEGEDDRLNKFFGMISGILQQRKKQVKGGSFSQYIQLHGHVLPAIIIVIDGYANFREKTDSRFEDILLELSRSAEGYGIYLIISCAGLGGTELQNKIADNMRQSICLELGDKYRYGEALRTMHFDVMPEENLKGRGLVSLDGTVLECQAALACQAKNDYERSTWIQNRCLAMSNTWQGKRAAQIPEIPQKPTWKLFTALDSYQTAVHGGAVLPVAYLQEDASLYSIDLSRSFCYLILGRERSGKSVFLRNIACAARDSGGKLVLFDSPAKQEEKTAQLTNAVYVTQPQELFEAVKELLLLTNARAPRRKALLGQGMEDEEVFEVIRAEFPPVYYLIADLEQFLTMLYTNLEGIGKLSAFLENIFAKGRLLNVHFFAEANQTQLIQMSDKPAYHHFVKERSGVLLGGELGKQTMFSYLNIDYKEQTKRQKPGQAYAVRQGDEENVDLIVIPQNKGLELV